MLLLSAQNEPLDDMYSIVTAGFLTPNKFIIISHSLLRLGGENTRILQKICEQHVCCFISSDVEATQRNDPLFFNGNQGLISEKLKPLKTLNSWGSSLFQWHWIFLCIVRGGGGVGGVGVGWDYSECHPTSSLNHPLSIHPRRRVCQTAQRWCQ